MEHTITENSPKFIQGGKIHKDFKEKWGTQIHTAVGKKKIPMLLIVYYEIHKSNSFKRRNEEKEEGKNTWESMN